MEAESIGSCRYWFALAGLFYHFDENGTGFPRGGRLAKKGDARSLDSGGGSDAEVEAKTVDGGHRRGLGVEFGVDLCEEEKGIGVVGVHVVEDALGDVGEGVGMGVGVVGCGDP